MPLASRCRMYGEDDAGESARRCTKEAVARVSSVPDDELVNVVILTIVPIICSEDNVPSGRSLTEWSATPRNTITTQQLAKSEGGEVTSREFREHVFSSRNRRCPRTHSRSGWIHTEGRIDSISPRPSAQYLLSPPVSVIKAAKTETPNQSHL